MKAALLIEGRDEGYLFLDAENAPDDAKPVTVTLDPDVFWNDVSDERCTVWLVNGDDTSKFRVVNDDGDLDHKCSELWFVVPTPTIVTDKDEYERLER